MKNNELGMDQLLELLKAHPELVGALVFEPIRITRLLKSKAGRRLVLGVDVKEFLKYIAGPGDGGPTAVCLRKTVALYAAKCQHLTRASG
jgi:hypothetical protein